MKYDAQQMEEQAVLATAATMCAAARTAPKATGLDHIETLVLTGADKDALADKMHEVATREFGDAPSTFHRLSLIHISLGLTLIISTAAVVFAAPIMRLAGTAEDTHEDAVAYFRIITGGMVFNTLTMVINAAQRGAGNTRIAMKTNIAANAVNICFNYLLIGGNLGFPKLGIRGAAIATVLGLSLIHI